MEGLPPHLNENQRDNIEKLLKDYADIFSRGEYDIERTMWNTRLTPELIVRSDNRFVDIRLST